MTINYRFSVFIFFMAMAITACKKDQANFPLKFYGERIEVKSKTRMFTSAGEEKDAAKIAEFTRDIPAFKAENDLSGKGGLALTFLSQDTALIGETTLKFAVKRDHTQFLFYSEHSFPFNPYDVNNPYGIVDFKKHLFKHTFTFGPPLAIPYGFLQSKEVKVAYGNFKELKFAMMAYYAVSINGHSINAINGLINNEFNEEALTMMKSGDKLAIKEYYLVCREK